MLLLFPIICTNQSEMPKTAVKVHFASLPPAPARQCLVEPELLPVLHPELCPNILWRVPLHLFAPLCGRGQGGVAAVGASCQALPPRVAAFGLPAFRLETWKHRPVLDPFAPMMMVQKRKVRNQCIHVVTSWFASACLLQLLWFFVTSWCRESKPEMD